MDTNPPSTKPPPSLHEVRMLQSWRVGSSLCLHYRRGAGQRWGRGHDSSFACRLDCHLPMKYSSSWLEKGACALSGKGKGLQQLTGYYTVPCARQCICPSVADTDLQPTAKAAKTWTVRVQAWQVDDWTYPSFSHTGGTPIRVSIEHVCRPYRSQGCGWLIPPRGSLGPAATSWDLCKYYQPIEWPVLWDSYRCGLWRKDL